jgi:hypothetical protein
MKLLDKILNFFKPTPKYSKLIKVDNKNHKMGESATYIFICAEGLDGKNKYLLFTENEIKNAEIRGSKNPEDLIK